MLNLFLENDNWMCNPSNGKSVSFHQYAADLLEKDQTMHYAVLKNFREPNVFVVINIDQVINERDHFIAFIINIVTSRDGKNHSIALCSIRDSVLAGQFVGRLTANYHDDLAITINTKDETNDLFGHQAL